MFIVEGCSCLGVRCCTVEKISQFVRVERVTDSFQMEFGGGWSRGGYNGFKIIKRALNNIRECITCFSINCILFFVLLG